jgi:hypothetical protein
MSVSALSMKDRNGFPILQIDPISSESINLIFNILEADISMLAKEHRNLGLGVEHAEETLYSEAKMRTAAFLFLEEMGLWHAFTFWAHDANGMDLRKEKLTSIYSEEEIKYHGAA